MKSLILREVNRFTVIIIYLFGLYIILHGHLSPGGGFAGGTILSAGLVFYKLVYPERSKRVITKDVLMKAICSSLLIYGGMKSYHIMHGIFAHEVASSKVVPYAIYSGGSLLVLNACVGIIVASTFYSITSLFLEGEL